MPGLRQVRDKLIAQCMFDFLQHFTLDRAHAKDPVHHLHGEIIRQQRQHSGCVFGRNLGQHHGDRLRIFVLQIIGEYGWLHI